MIVVHFSPEQLRDLLGLPKHYIVRNVEWRDGAFCVYACDGRDDGDLIVEIEHPEYRWRSINQMKLPEGI